MYDLHDLRAISEGADPHYVEMFGADLLDEANMNPVDQTIKKYKLYTSEKSKEGKKHFKAGKKLRKTDPKAAVAEYDKAIACYKDCLKECNKIEDDNYFTLIVFSLCKVLAGALIVGGLAGNALKHVTPLGMTIGMLSSVDVMKYNNRTNIGKTEKSHDKKFGSVGITRSSCKSTFEVLIQTAEKEKSKIK